jgi:hypothetical protein
MKKAFLIAVALILAVGFIACQDEFTAIRNAGESKILEPDGAGSSPYFPYEAGRKWNYEAIWTFALDYSEDIPIEDTSWADTFTYVTEVIQETELTGSNPLSVWEIRTTLDSGEIVYSYAHIEPDSAYFYEKLSDSEPWYAFPSEPKLGNKWTIEIETVIIDSIVGTDTFTTTLTSRTDYEVVADGKTANGYEDCLKIEVIPENVEDYDEYENFQYWAWNEGGVLYTSRSVTKIGFGEDTMVVTVEGETRLIKGTGIEE